MPYSKTDLPLSAFQLLRIAKLATWAGLLLFVSVALWGVLAIFKNGAAFDAVLAENFLAPDESGQFSIAQRFFGGMIMMFSIATGIVGLWVAGRLFGGYLRGDVFSLNAAYRIRFIGWMVVLLFPMSVVGELVGRYFFTSWIQPGRINIEISVGDGDVFALVFGLLIVIVGHVMYQAIAISEENQSFV